MSNRQGVSFWSNGRGTASKSAARKEQQRLAKNQRAQQNNND